MVVKDMATEDEVRRLLRRIEASPEVRSEVQRAILTEELLGLPGHVAVLTETTARFEARTDERLGRLETDVAELKTDVAELKTDVAELKTDVAELKTDVAELKTDMAQVKNTLNTDVADLKGMMFEAKFERNPGYFLTGVVGNVVLIPRAGAVRELGLDGRLSAEELSVLETSDFFARGTLVEEGIPVVAVVEVTWRAHIGDVRRQARRRHLLEAGGIEAVAIVAAHVNPVPDVRRLAHEHGVKLIIRTVQGEDETAEAA